jgi:hypothetical protein
VEVVVLEDDFLRSRAARGDTLRVGRCSSSLKSRSWCCDVDSASLEVERAVHATHAAVVELATATAADGQFGMDDEQASNV